MPGTHIQHVTCPAGAYPGCFDIVNSTLSSNGFGPFCFSSDDRGTGYRGTGSRFMLRYMRRFMQRFM